MAVSTVRATVFTGLETRQVLAVLTPYGPSMPLVDYFVEKKGRFKWMTEVAWSYRIFVEFITSYELQSPHYELFSKFARLLAVGSIDRLTGIDELGLGWRALSPKRQQTVIVALTKYFDWLHEKNPNIEHFNPHVEADALSRRLNVINATHRRNKAFLGNTWLPGERELNFVRHTKLYSGVATEEGEQPTFPEEFFESLLYDGFKVGRRWDLRGILITILLHCAGFRESEPFHLFVGDVFPDPQNHRTSSVLIHHPEHGAAPSDWEDERGNPVKGNRAEYLQARWGLLPRHTRTDSAFAGWKCKIHEKDYGSVFLRAYWFEPWWGEFFLALWYRYLAQILTLPRSHPFAFVNTGRHPLGALYKINQFEEAHSNAVRRIGLPVSKDAGTTTHGHRHAYGRRLEDAGLSEQMIRRAMHHSSIISQEVYTAPSLKKVQRALTEAALKLNESLPSSSTRLRELIQ
ncbi:MAG: site-specific integrase [Proteobacteria bacterium]|nr:site-specific integrase [Pseudomonadota bacterium]